MPFISLWVPISRLSDDCYVFACHLNLVLAIYCRKVASNHVTSCGKSVGPYCAHRYGDWWEVPNRSRHTWIIALSVAFGKCRSRIRLGVAVGSWRVWISDFISRFHTVQLDGPVRLYNRFIISIRKTDVFWSAARKKKSFVSKRSGFNREISPDPPVVQSRLIREHFPTFVTRYRVCVRFTQIVFIACATTYVKNIGIALASGCTFKSILLLS